MIDVGKQTTVKKDRTKFSHMKFGDHKEHTIPKYFITYGMLEKYLDQEVKFNYQFKNVCTYPAWMDIISNNNDTTPSFVIITGVHRTFVKNDLNIDKEMRNYCLCARSDEELDRKFNKKTKSQYFFYLRKIVSLLTSSENQLTTVLSPTLKTFYILWTVVIWLEKSPCLLLSSLWRH